MRKITSHVVNPANDRLAIEVHDEPGAGGANHAYAVYGFHTRTNPSADTFSRDETCLKVLFQNGPIPEAGVNGVTQEVLLAIVADRLQSFQAGPYACAANAEALKHVEAAQEALLSRTRARMARGVEGTHKL
jgi:hypothetical protein